MTKIFYLGPNGSYSNIVAKKVLEKTDYELIPCNSFLDIVNNTICSINTIGILPIENSITSDIHENIDYLFQNNLSIIYEAFLRINLHVIGLKNTTISDIKNVYSHPRALAQCTKFTSQHHVKTFETISTSAAKEFILQNKEKANAIIGSRELLSDHQLSLIQENIGNDQYNLTRFVFVSIDKTRNISAVKNKTTIIFQAPHIPGSLAKVLTAFAKDNYNLTKIESRPIPGTDWEYQFWIDIEDPEKDLVMQNIEKILQTNTTTYKIIGVYQSGKVFQS